MWQPYLDREPDDRFRDECEAFQWDNHAHFNQDGVQVAVSKGDWMVRYLRITPDEADREKPKDKKKVGKGWYYTAYTNDVFTRRFVVDTKPRPKKDA